MAPFFDAFAIGDGEEMILELADELLRWKKMGEPEKIYSEQWKRIPGIFVPGLHEPGDKVSRRIVSDIETAGFPTQACITFLRNSA